MTHPEHYYGSCHCGAIAVEIRTISEAKILEPRACQCSFCRRHGARTVADPQGRATISAQDSNAITRYRFARKTADFLICATCGTYVAALMDNEGAARSTINVNGLGIDALRTPDPQPVSYDGETVDERIARRKQRWMPTELIFGSQSAEPAAN